MGENVYHLIRNPDPTLGNNGSSLMPARLLAEGHKPAKLRSVEVGIVGSTRREFRFFAREVPLAGMDLQGNPVGRELMVEAEGHTQREAQEVGITRNTITSRENEQKVATRSDRESHEARELRKKRRKEIRSNRKRRKIKIDETPTVTSSSIADKELLRQQRKAKKDKWKQQRTARLAARTEVEE